LKVRQSAPEKVSTRIHVVQRPDRSRKPRHTQEERGGGVRNALKTVCGYEAAAREKKKPGGKEERDAANEKTNFKSAARGKTGLKSMERAPKIYMWGLRVKLR